MAHDSRCEPPVPGRVRIPGEGTLPYAYVLAELEAVGLPADGLYLWRLLRRLDGWREALQEESEPADPPPGTYEQAAPAIQPTLAAVDRLLRGADPDEATLEALALGFMHLATWAEERGALGTTVALLHGAEGLGPDNPHFAYNIGRVARKLAAYPDAEAWLKWAHFVARTEERWDVATLALSGLGNLYRQRGNLPRARRFHTVARKMAKRHGLRTLEGDALYELAGISFDLGDPATGMSMVHQAIAVYGFAHNRIYTLAHDLAWVWMDKFGQFESAARVLTALIDHVWEPAERVLLYGNLTRAAAGAGWTDVFEKMWNETWALMRGQMVRVGHAGALIQLAYGAGNLGYWERASIAAAEALEVARARRENEMIFAAEGILEAVSSGIIMEERAGALFGDGVQGSATVRSDDAADLVSAISNAMNERRDGAPERPTSKFLGRR